MATQQDGLLCSHNDRLKELIRVVAAPRRVVFRIWKWEIEATIGGVETAPAGDDYEPVGIDWLMDLIEASVRIHDRSDSNRPPSQGPGGSSSVPRF